MRNDRQALPAITGGRVDTLIVSCLLVLLAACAGNPRQPSASQSSEPQYTAEVRDALHAQHEQWSGTPYRLGGQDRGGIDCSAFVQTTFSQRFDTRLPRTTERQAKLGQPMERAALRAGDLVFFKTGWGKRHVGIYVEDERFLHASTSHGVTLSSLENPYWAGHYWQARRLRGW